MWGNCGLGAKANLNATSDHALMTWNYWWMNELNVFLTHDYHEFESQSYGTLWHCHVAACSLTFITVAKVRWRSQRGIDRSHDDRTCLCLVERAFGREMAEPRRCTISRANDLATTTNLRHDSECRRTSSTLSLKRSTSFEVDVEHLATVWCWRFYNWFGFFGLVWSKKTSPKRKNRKVKNLSFDFVAKKCLKDFNRKDCRKAKTGEKEKERWF